MQPVSSYSGQVANPSYDSKRKLIVVLKDKVALVTGASLGIGRAICVALAEAGADVCINFRSHQEQADAVAAAVEKAGRRALVHRCDVSDQSAVEAMVEAVARHFGRLDITVTNAVYSDREPFVTANMEGFRRTLDVTMWGAFYTVRAAANQMLSQGGGGSIVVVSSPHAYVPVPGAMAYNMAKAALDHMARTAAIELIKDKIRVNLVHPGWIDTPGERKFVEEQQLQAAGSELPWGRLGQPEEIARGVVFLCDPASDYMTGSSLLIDGGVTLPWHGITGAHDE